MFLLQQCLNRAWFIEILTAPLVLNLMDVEMESQVHWNFHAKSEAAINHRVNLELYGSSYAYLSISYYSDRDDVPLRHVPRFLKEQSCEPEGNMQRCS